MGKRKRQTVSEIREEAYCAGYSRGVSDSAKEVTEREDAIRAEGNKAGYAEGRGEVIRQLVTMLGGSVFDKAAGWLDVMNAIHQERERFKGAGFQIALSDLGFPGYVLERLRKQGSLEIKRQMLGLYTDTAQEFKKLFDEYHAKACAEVSKIESESAAQVSKIEAEHQAKVAKIESERAARTTTEGVASPDFSPDAPSDETGLNANEKRWVGSLNHISAIKAVRTRTGLGLLKCKNLCDRYRDRNKV